MSHKSSVIFVTCIFPLILALIALFEWRMGNNAIAVMSVGTIPLIFFCWGLSHLLAGPQRREIARHLTDDERAELNRMSMSFGANLGAFGATPLAMLSVVSFYVFDQSPIAFAVPFVVGLMIIMPIAYRQEKPIRDFFFETEYAMRNVDHSATRPTSNAH
jgi:hypothetical protein